MTPGGFGKSIEITALGSPEDLSKAPQETQDDSHCGNCKFYRSDNRCQRFPPHGSEWSMVGEDDWCGEWASGPQKESHAMGTEEQTEVEVM